MTTIACKAGTMAADSRCTDEKGQFVTRVPKIYLLDSKALLGSAGDADDRDVVTVLNRATPRRLPSRADLASTETEFEGLLLFPNGQLFFVDVHHTDNGWVSSVLECKERFASVGSGSKYALGAMTFGANAKEAVEVACRFDTASGPPVTTMRMRK